MHPIDRVHNKVTAGFVLNLYGEWVTRNTALASKRELLKHVFAGEVEINGRWIPVKQSISLSAGAPVKKEDQSAYARTYSETYASTGEPMLTKGYVKSDAVQSPSLNNDKTLENTVQHIPDLVLKRTIQLNADTVLSIFEVDIMLNKVVTFAIDGYLDQSDCSHVSNEIITRIQADVRFLICDLSRSTLVTSAGWGMLAAVKGQLSKVHGDLYVSGMPGEIEESFRLLQFGSVIKKSTSVNDCLLRIMGTIQHSMIESATSYVPGERLIAPSGAPLPDEMPLQEKIKAIIAQFGPVSIFEMMKILKEKEFGKETVGLLKLYKLLREMNLDTKTKQIRFYRSC
jgi:anti-anti-sigma regulatory factor